MNSLDDKDSLTEASRGVAEYFGYMKFSNLYNKLLKWMQDDLSKLKIYE